MSDPSPHIPHLAPISATNFNDISGDAPVIILLCPVIDSDISTDVLSRFSLEVSTVISEDLSYTLSLFRYRERYLDRNFEGMNECMDD